MGAFQSSSRQAREAGEVVSYRALVSGASQQDVDLVEMLSPYLFMQSDEAESRMGEDKFELANERFEELLRRTAVAITGKKKMVGERFDIVGFRMSAPFYLLLTKSVTMHLVLPPRLLDESGNEKSRATRALAALMHLGTYWLARIYIEGGGSASSSSLTAIETGGMGSITAHKVQIRGMIHDAMEMQREVGLSYYAQLLETAVQEIHEDDFNMHRDDPDQRWTLEERAEGGYVLVKNKVSSVTVERVGTMFEEGKTPLDTSTKPYLPEGWKEVGSWIYYPRVTVRDLTGQIKSYIGDYESSKGGFWSSLESLYGTEDVIFIAGGGFGRVYMVRDGATEKAVKYFDTRQSSTDSTGEFATPWFKHKETVNELFAWQHVADLDPTGQNTVQIDRIITFKNTIFKNNTPISVPQMLGVVMPLARGSVRDLMQDFKYFNKQANTTNIHVPVSVLWKVTKQMIQAVYWLHKVAGTAHRDIKEMNFLYYTNLTDLIGKKQSMGKKILRITMSELDSITVKLADFGFAVVAEEKHLNRTKYMISINEAHEIESPNQKISNLVPRSCLQFENAHYYTSSWRPLERFLRIPQVISSWEGNVSSYFKSDVFALGISIGNLWNVEEPDIFDLDDYVRYHGFLHNSTTADLFYLMEKIGYHLVKDPTYNDDPNPNLRFHKYSYLKLVYQCLGKLKEYLQKPKLKKPEAIITNEYKDNTLLREMINSDWKNRPNITAVMHQFDKFMATNPDLEKSDIFDIKAINPDKISPAFIQTIGGVYTGDATTYVERLTRLIEKLYDTHEEILK